ncbi:MAG: molybdate ABC transporter substrate-binding protein [Mariprofundales bacterium]|nr:molybdate ABC transporter substrate-binding protein [Mariprofundales bacterium]
MLSISILLPHSSVAEAGERLTVAVASSLYPAMERAAHRFEQLHHLEIRLVAGSTGRLYNQIVHGAPFDLFIAADQQRPALLSRRGRVVAQCEVGVGYLGLSFSHLSSGEVGDGFAKLTSPAIRAVVIANPDVAPFGKLSRDILRRRGLWQELQHKLVYAQSALQAATMVRNGLVDAGFVPIGDPSSAVATLHYQAVLLVDSALARLLIEAIASGSGSGTSLCHGV